MSLLGSHPFFSSLFPMENPSFLKASAKVLKISCGTTHMIILDSMGTMLGLGSNEFGQMGQHLRDNKYIKEFDD